MQVTQDCVLKGIRCTMLVLTRHRGQSIVFPDLGIDVRVVEINGGTVRLGVTAPREIVVVREELLDDSQRDTVIDVDRLSKRMIPV